MAGVLPWSYSSLTAFETCPRRFYLTRITKQVSEPQTPHTVHGNEVHKALEHYVTNRAPLPEKYASYKPIADKVKTTPGQVHAELKFGLTRELWPTTFFAKDVWVRGVLDVAVLRKSDAVVLDWKTGKRKVDSDQLRLFAGAALSLWPQVKRVRTGFVWLPDQKLDTDTFTLQDRPKIFQDFAARVYRMELAERENKWVPNPSGLCREWCPVGKKLCNHCGKD